MKRKIIVTDDGSTTIHIPEWNEQYHSTHGAIQEAQHVFVKAGLHHYILENKTKNVAILEIGLGTALNAFMTLLEAEKLDLQIEYHGVEAYPISLLEINQLNYPEQLNAIKKKQIFNTIHDVPWEDIHHVTDYFQLKKVNKDFSEIDYEETFHLIYFDAFGARVQPELWVESIFEIMYKALKTQGVLVTYSAKGSVRRAMQSVGFIVERLEGPPGKREMLRATKP
ncbi:tRNA (5-methylaminomethyl-2-thiouridine)(34)-methyltransferase MnmD [Lacinutrix iliipiscaria]|uniref:tRNA (5-methylaminomethyl-2-thiouridine)(34)-methyltransferase MnmD n=1 Tax=Lacinutrix iliipiscaria TaxID=1230532 RepID=A0ABW5WRX6_9FLAO